MATCVPKKIEELKALQEDLDRIIATLEHREAAELLTRMKAVLDYVHARK